MKTTKAIKAKLEYLRGELRAERISYGELAELQGLGEAGHIPEHDVELREAAGLPEFPEGQDRENYTDTQDRKNYRA